MAGVKDKISNVDVLSFILNFHIVWLLEIKTNACISVPGFYVYHNPSKWCSKRGGVAMLVKNSLVKFITRVDVGTEGQVWVEFSCYPGFIFGGIYIPPNDSPYYHPSLFGSVEAYVNEHSKVVALGDYNSRVGSPCLCDSNSEQYEYAGIVDEVVNENGKQLINLCRSSGAVVGNHLLYKGKSFGGGLTFKRKTRWISEIDLCVLKEEVLDNVRGISVNHTVTGSDHAPLVLELNFSGITSLAPALLQERAEYLGVSWVMPSKSKFLVKSVRFSDVDIERFKRMMNEEVVPDLQGMNTNTIAGILETSYSVINNVANGCKKANAENGRNEWVQDHPRWKRILDRGDLKTIWKAINWKGSITDVDDKQPDDVQFKLHFEKLLNPSPVTVEPYIDVCASPYIPVLDDPFTLQELDTVTKMLKKDKSYTGLCPGLFSSLPIIWLFFLTIFNFVFTRVCYPIFWCHNKLITLFKSGLKMDCGNYRGISIMNTLAKVYDLLIMKRLVLWMNIDKCQAGARKGRGCVEHIMSLRLLIDYAIYKKKKLFVLFVDFSKAYDRVPRDKLLECLRRMGCGKTMLLAIRTMYHCTKNVLKSAIITSTVGVRQGAPTSCFLFVLYIDQMIKMMKERMGVDGFLGSLHAFLMMDDTVIIATSREKCTQKLFCLKEYCDLYGMVINEKKTKFFVINGEMKDKESLNVNDIKVDYCHKYLYLGAWFTDDGKMKSVLEQHEIQGTSAINKFSMFCVNNTTMPFTYKKKVFSAALTASLLYSAETWLTNNPKNIEKLYNKAVKCLLGVRSNTPITLCLLESGINTMMHEIKVRRKRFLKKKMQNVDNEEPFHYVYDLCRNENTPGYRFVKESIDQIVGHSSLSDLSEEVRSKPENATKYVAYRSMLNPQLTVHSIYDSDKYIPDFLREAFTRLRVMSHSLRIETGRWSRTPRELRKCNCNLNVIQDEQHVLIECPLSQPLRQIYGNLEYASIQNLLSEENNLKDLCNYIYGVLNCMANQADP